MSKIKVTRKMLDLVALKIMDWYESDDAPGCYQEIIYGETRTFPQSAWKPHWIREQALALLDEIESGFTICWDGVNFGVSIDGQSGAYETDTLSLSIFLAVHELAKGM